jgi:hypothetical protein
MPVVAAGWWPGGPSSLLDVELDRLAFPQGLQPAGLHRADVHEHVLALLGAAMAVAEGLRWIAE